MTLEPLLDASPAIQLHVAAVVPAAVIGGLILAMRKGTFVHRMAGRLWMLLMVLTALSSFFIHEIDLFFGFSPIHILSLVVLASAFEAIRSARRRNIVRHQRIVKSMYFGGIGIAGAFTLLPGRIMHDVVFASAVAEPARAAAPIASQVVAGAPIWVWPLLVALVALGVSRMRDREMPVLRLLMLPAILAAVLVFGAVSGSLSGSRLSAALIGAAAGLLAGWWSLRTLETVRLADNRVLVKGEIVSLLAILAIFASRFTAGAFSVVAPDLLEREGMAELFVLIPVFFAALMAARALAQAGYNPLRRKGRRLSVETQC